MPDIAPTFIRSLITDVIVARDHLSGQDDQPHRRNAIRTSFAAIEGLAWLLRDHVLSIGTELQLLEPEDRLALSDTGYRVSESGELKSVPQYLPLKIAIKYAIRRAQTIAPGFAVDYADAGWSCLLTATEIRNRITHPKTADGLIIEQADLDVIFKALLWLLAVVEAALQAMTAAFRTDNEEMKALLLELTQGDPDVLRLYNELLLHGE